ncbi:MAG TPA: hypothetical protein VFM18_17340 [Methanosarcina sp.]|nr:hypothetical protein [Methanosarcina sp.]
MSGSAICVGDVTDPTYGPAGTVISGAATVLVGPSSRMAAQLGSPVTPHGNPSNPLAPGFDPICASASILSGSSTVIVENKPMATMEFAQCTCGLHSIVATGEPTVIVGS